MRVHSVYLGVGDRKNASMRGANDGRPVTKYELGSDELQGVLALNRVENSRAIIQANLDYLIARVLILKASK